MSEIRKLEKAAREYEKILLNKPEEAKMYHKECRREIKALLSITESYIDSESKMFLLWADESAKNFNEPEGNIFKRIKRKIDMLFVNHFLNKISYNLSKAGTIKRGLEKMDHRFMQFEYWN